MRRQHGTSDDARTAVALPPLCHGAAVRLPAACRHTAHQVQEGGRSERTGDRLAFTPPAAPHRTSRRALALLGTTHGEHAKGALLYATLSLAHNCAKQAAGENRGGAP